MWALYDDNLHYVVAKRARFDDITLQVFSGVRQGCPLSALLFTVALIPYVHLYIDSLGPDLGMLRKWLDDMIMVVKKLAMSLRKVQDIIEIFSKISQPSQIGSPDLMGPRPGKGPCARTSQIQVCR